MVGVFLESITFIEQKSLYRWITKFKSSFWIVKGSLEKVVVFFYHYTSFCFLQNINTLGAECLFCNEEIFLFTSAGFTTYITDLHRHISNFFCNSKECIVSGACNILLKSLYSTDIAKHTLLKHLPMYNIIHIW